MNDLLRAVSLLKPGQDPEAEDDFRVSWCQRVLSEAPLLPTQLVVPAVYRVGTLLEMVRDMATALALDGKRVKVCVQAAMGQGVFQVI